VPWLAQILLRINRIPEALRSFEEQEFATARANSLPGEARGGCEEVVRGLGHTGEVPEEFPAVSLVGEKSITIARSV
jgi:hypothetical protein